MRRGEERRGEEGEHYLDWGCQPVPGSPPETPVSSHQARHHRHHQQQQQGRPLASHVALHHSDRSDVIQLTARLTGFNMLSCADTATKYFVKPLKQ